MALKTWANVDEVIYGDDLNGNFSGLAAGTEISSGAITRAKLENDIVYGWYNLSETFTYGSPTTITIASGGTPRFAVGDKLRLKQGGGFKYFYIVIAGSTTLTITGGTDYVLSNAAITDVGISRELSPVGHPVWFNYTPTLTGFSADPTVNLSRFMVSGRACTVVHSESATGTSNATTLTFTLPVTSASAVSNAFSAPAQVRDNGIVGTTPGLITVGSAATTASVFKDWNGTAFTNTGNKQLIFGQITYQI